MIRAFLIVTFLVLFALPVASLADTSTGNEAPLTLLQQPSKNNQTTPVPSRVKEDNELHDIHGPVSITEQPPYLLLAGSILVLLAIAAALYWFMKKRTGPAPPPVPPWEKALQDLAEARRLLTPERALLYMDRVSRILRSYIESRFAIKSTRQTTREFLRGLAKIGGNSPLQTYKADLQICLEQADMAKFAHYTQDIHSLEKIGEAVTDFIRKTEPQEPAKPVKPSKRSRRGGS